MTQPGMAPVPAPGMPHGSYSGVLCNNTKQPVQAFMHSIFIMCLLNYFSQRNAPNDAWCSSNDARDAPCHARDASRVSVNSLNIAHPCCKHVSFNNLSFLLHVTNSMMPMSGMMPPTHGMPPMMPGMPPGTGTFQFKAQYVYKRMFFSVVHNYFIIMVKSFD